MPVAHVAEASMVNASGTSKTVTSPSTNSAHKLMALVVIEDASNISARTITPNNSTGTWTLIGRQNHANGTVACALYVGLGGYTTTFTIDTAVFGGLQVWATSGSNLGASLDASSFTTGTATNTHTLTNLTTIADNCMVFAGTYFFEWWDVKSSAAFNTEDDELAGQGMYHHTVLKTPAGAFGAASVVKAGGTAGDSVGVIFSVAPPTGTAYTISPAGSVTPAGDLVKKTGKAAAGSVQPAGVVAKKAAKPVAGAVTPLGVLANKTAKALAGSVTPAGTVALVVRKAILVDGLVTPAGNLIKKITKAVAGSVQPEGVLTKKTASGVAGSITPEGTLAKKTAKALSGSVAPEGGLTRKIGKAVSGSVTPAATVTWKIAKVLAGSVQPLGTLINNHIPGGGGGGIVARAMHEYRRRRES